MLVAFNKPYGVISQFTPDGSPNRTLAEFGFRRELYPIGRLDADSEGLLLLTDEGDLNERLLHPRAQHERTYWAQVERIPTPDELDRLQKGVAIQNYETLPSRAHILDPQPEVGPRDPPVRYRKNVPDVWIELTLTEGKNRQVRRMTAAIGHPTLRLIRVGIGRLVLAKLSLHPGQWRELTPLERKDVFKKREDSD
jgi:23S rRNA pseudouridine2457 synthase